MRFGTPAAPRRHMSVPCGMRLANQATNGGHSLGGLLLLAAATPRATESKSFGHKLREVLGASWPSERLASNVLHEPDATAEKPKVVAALQSASVLGPGSTNGVD